MLLPAVAPQAASQFGNHGPRLFSSIGFNVLSQPPGSTQMPPFPWSFLSPPAKSKPYLHQIISPDGMNISSSGIPGNLMGKKQELFSDTQDVNNVIFVYFSELNTIWLKPPRCLRLLRLHLKGTSVWLSPCSWAVSGLWDFHSPGKTDLFTPAVFRGCHHSAHQSIQKWLALICCPRAGWAEGLIPGSQDHGGRSWCSVPRLSHPAP